MIIVFDTSVLFSAFAFPKGICAQIIRASLTRHDLATSTHILQELHHHLAGKTRLPLGEIQQVLAILREAGPLITPATVAADACRDPNDLPVLGTALAAKADVLVSGDKDLLTLGRFQGIPILSPREFHDRLPRENKYPEAF